ncbi:hypothetical protein C2857_007901 [Epichloe festucae Fl1]|uniref:Uncharacterized protein n=1 Tax=Epichloe festucae (strain Fl1) TaxID=877507 RepID=A0A7S9KN02_EPIFF|nr:hypothetical protein C2857_007901 [Epichloe festucae Fl1]
MQHLSQPVSGPSLQSSPELTSYSTSRDQEDVREAAARGELKELRGAAFFNRTWVFGPRHLEGTLWNDLPFLVTDMTDFWINNCATMAGSQRINFASFLAKLASTGILKGRICHIALILFRNAFEEGRDLRTTEDPDNEDPTRSIKGLDVAHLLPAAFVWIKEAGYNLMQLSESSWNDCPSSVGQGGQLYLQSELGRRSAMGFTPWRWMFWLKRLHEIQEEAKDAKEKRLDDLATEAIDIMIANVKERNSDILRTYQSSGEAVHQDKHLRCLQNLVESKA